MRKYRYNALTSAGEQVSGLHAGPDSAAVIAWLHSQALLPIDAAEQDEAAPARPKRRSGPLPGAELCLISQQLARLLKAGLPLDRALALLIDLIPARATRQCLQAVLDRVRDGAGLAEALGAQGKSFPQTFITLVRAGEMSSALQPVLAETAVFLQRAEAIRHHIISAMVYPAILILVAALSVGLILTAVLPQFEPMFQQAGTRLPAITQAVITAGDLLRGYWWLIAGLLVALVLAARAVLRTPTGALARDRALLALPVIGPLVLRVETGRFCRTLGVMVASGVPAPTALELSGATLGNGILAAAVADAALRFREGDGLSAPLARSGRFPQLALQLIRIGEETARLDEMLAEVASLFDHEVQRALERLLAALVPALTVSMGLLVAVIVAAVMMALLSVNALAV